MRRRDAGIEWIVGGIGNDTLSGGNEQDWVFGDDANDRATPGGDDVIYGDDGHDFLYGEDGDDWINGGEGYDGIAAHQTENRGMTI